MQKIKIGVLISGSGSNLQAIIDGIEKGEINGEISIVISDKKDAYGLERAKNHGIKTMIVDRKDYKDRHRFIFELMKVLKDYKVELVVLAGFLTILTKDFVEEYKGRIINVHPSLIPSFCGEGYYGQKVHQAVLDYGTKISGATVHFVDEKADTGPIIMQGTVPVMEDDTSETLATRILKIEHKILPEAIKLYCAGKITIDGRKVRIKR